MTAPYTAAELAAISARAEKATPGPWAKNGRWCIRTDNGSRAYGPIVDRANATFIAAAREDVPRLVAELTRARETLREYGSHTDTCLGGEYGRALEPGEGEGRTRCDCGFRAALGEESADGDSLDR